ncbi:MAG: peptide-methionine (S)-S-oxide reductase [Elusimicrobia bacterium RIFCSPLOWO2_01_FULL_60_11]|nr:MAG: peptide-methionine (S)-S-oxide reductase [Elusimicrobia bacterium RIFCSPLOWO2_01_FULL_60_11]
MENKMEVAIFGGGCFWCTEAVFEDLKGVSAVMPGYAGGNMEKPTYEDVCSGKTGHAEVIRIEYDPSQIAYTDLLTVFFATHNPTTPNQQGADVGTQYRSAVFYTTEAQKKEAEAFIAKLNEDSGPKAVTEVVPLTNFYEAEEYHRKYYQNNSSAPYCQVVINPKLEKVREKFNQLLKESEAR